MKQQFITFGIILCLLTSCSSPLDKKYSSSDFDDDIQEIRESESTDSVGIALLEWIPIGILSGVIRNPVVLEGKTYREIIDIVRKSQSGSNTLDKKFSVNTLEDDIQKIREGKSTDAFGMQLLEGIQADMPSVQESELLEEKTYLEIINEVREYQEKRASTPDPITVKEYCQVWEENGARAEGLYGGKRVTLSGKIFDIGSVPIGDEHSYVTLDAMDGSCHVLCYFPEEYKEKLYELKKGQQITIVGTGWGFSRLSLSLKNCSIY